MNVSIGQRLGSFEVSAVLGRGGMGEVWLATDERLGREVALKVLPENFAEDPERHARFEREAKVLASLNHPNIATLFGLEHLEGSHVLVMEFVDGEGLDERIDRGPIAGDKAIAIAIQIADALEAAHEAGIVHRDLKPANVRVRPDGTVKVLDFGLAKSWEADGGESSLSMSPTMTRHATAAGVILGTAAYMSPEQARGKPVDQRADIWAFGVLLWEMLTGKKLFDGDTASDVMAGVLRAEIDLAKLPKTSPPALRRLLRRCLERSEGKRLRHFGDARIELEEALGCNDLDPASPTVDDSPTGRFRAPMIWAVAMVVITATAVLGTMIAMRREAPPLPKHLSVVLPPEMYLLAEGNSTLTFDPTGRRIVLSGQVGGKQVLLRRELGEMKATPITGTDYGQAVFYSPDGQWIGFTAQDQLMKVPAEGGTPFRLADSRGAGGAAWMSDNTLIFAPLYSDGLFRVSADGGEVTRLTAPDREAGELGHWWPEPLPGSRKVVFTAFRTPVDRSRIGVLDLETGDVQWVVDGGFFGRYAASGHLLYAKDQRLFAVPFDPETATVTGAAVSLVDDLRVSQTGGFGMFAVSTQGDLAYVTESHGNPPRELVWLDRSGRAQPAMNQRHRFLSVSLSPDNRHAAVTIQGDSRDLWTLAFDRGILSRLTTSSDTEFDARWSSDGRELYYVVDSPPFELFRIPVGVPDNGRKIWDERADVDVTEVAVAPGGRWLAFVQSEAQTGNNIYRRAIDDDAPPTPFRASRAKESYPSFSPDGRWLAYQSNETGRTEIYVEAFPGPGERFQISANGGYEPVWSHGSQEIFFLNDDELHAVEVRTDGGRPEVGASRVLFSHTITRGDSVDGRTYDVNIAGDRILAVSTPVLVQPRRLEIITGLVPELARLAPSAK